MRGMGPNICIDLAYVRARFVLHGWVAMCEGPNLLIAVRFYKNWSQGAHRSPRILDRSLALQAATELGRGWRGAWARLLKAWAYRWQDRGQLATLGPAQSTEFQIEPTLEQIIIVIENTPFWWHSAHLKTS